MSFTTDCFGWTLFDRMIVMCLISLPQTSSWMMLQGTLDNSRSGKQCVCVWVCNPFKNGATDIFILAIIYPEVQPKLTEGIFNLNLTTTLHISGVLYVYWFLCGDIQENAALKPENTTLCKQIEELHKINIQHFDVVPFSLVFNTSSDKEGCAVLCSLSRVLLFI